MILALLLWQLLWFIIGLSGFLAVALYVGLICFVTDKEFREFVFDLWRGR